MPKPTQIAVALAADGRTAEIGIRGIVGVSWDVTSREIAWWLDQYKDVQHIVVRINSLGGLVHEGIGICNMLRAHPAHIQVIVEGVAGSAASVVAMAGDEIVMYANSLMMIHGVRVVEEDDWGNEIDTPEAREASRAFNAAMIETYRARTGKSDEELAALLETDTWMTAREAVAAGFADRVEELAAPEASEPTAATALAVLAAAANIPAAVLARAQAEGATTEPAIPEGGDPSPGPAPSADPESAPEPESAETFAAQINALAVAHGLGDYVAAWLLDGAISTEAQARAAIAEAREVRDLCAFAGVADQAPAFIRARKPLAEVRTALINARADAADALHTNGHPRTPPPVQATNAARGWDDAFAKLKTVRSM